MENTGITPVMDINSRNYGYNDSMYGGAWIWILVLMCMFNNGGWGNNNQYAETRDVYQNGNAVQNDVNNGFSHLDTQNDLRMMQVQLSDAVNDNTIANLQGFNNVQVANLQGFNATQRDILATSNATQREILGGFNNMQMSACQGFNALNTGLLENRYSALQGFNGVERGIDANRYAMAQNTCQIETNSTANTQKILDKLCMMESNAKDNTIQELRAQLLAAQGAFSQAMQTQGIVSAVRPYPTPAYVVSSPYVSTTTGTTTTA